MPPLLLCYSLLCCSTILRINFSHFFPCSIPRRLTSFLLCCHLNCGCSVQALYGLLVWVCCIAIDALLDLSFSLSFFSFYLGNSFYLLWIQKHTKSSVYLQKIPVFVLINLHILLQIILPDRSAFMFHLRMSKQRPSQWRCGLSAAFQVWDLWFTHFSPLILEKCNSSFVFCASKTISD